MNIEVQHKYESYPDHIRIRLLEIRALIFTVAENEALHSITETLKWGELSYLAKNGSTLRMDWKPQYPNKISVYFNCNTKLIATFREVFGDSLQFVGNREIALPLEGELPIPELTACLSMSLRYHKIKHLPLLGA